MADVAPPLTGQDLEHELERLLEIERFDPPSSFTDHALLCDPAVPAQGVSVPIKPAVDAVIGELASLETVVVVRHTGQSVPMQAGQCAACSVMSPTAASWAM